MFLWRWIIILEENNFLVVFPNKTHFKKIRILLTFQSILNLKSSMPIYNKLYIEQKVLILLRLLVKVWIARNISCNKKSLKFSSWVRKDSEALLKVFRMENLYMAPLIYLAVQRDELRFWRGLRVSFGWTTGWRWSVTVGESLSGDSSTSVLFLGAPRTLPTSGSTWDTLASEIPTAHSTDALSSIGTILFISNLLNSRVLIENYRWWWNLMTWLVQKIMNYLKYNKKVTAQTRI